MYFRCVLEVYIPFRRCLDVEGLMMIDLHDLSNPFRRIRPRKSNMTMEKQTFEAVSPIKNGDVPC